MRESAKTESYNFLLLLLFLKISVTVMQKQEPSADLVLNNRREVRRDGLLTVQVGAREGSQHINQQYKTLSRLGVQISDESQKPGDSKN